MQEKNILVKNKKYDKKYWFSILLSILLFIIGFFVGKSYVINGDFADLQNEYNLLNSSYSKLIVQNSQGNIITQNQQGNNLLVTPKKPPRKLNAKSKSKIDNMLNQYEGKSVVLNYLNGDSEVYDFANEIREYLTQKGYNVKGSSIITSGKMEGQSMYINDEGILTFSIGSQI